MARVRTEEKRSEIVRIAAELFEKLGFDRCSMAALSERLGGCKATIYGDLPTKGELIGAIDAADPKRMKKAVNAAADAFLQLYGTAKSRPAERTKAKAAA